jgi:hypothetical protein
MLFSSRAHAQMVKNLIPLRLVIVLMMEAVSTSECSVSSYETTKRNVPRDIHLYLSSEREYNAGRHHVVTQA